MKAYGFIFARGGSKGLPGKNTKLFAGKPLIQHSIEVAQKVPSLSKVFVSTDDTHIAEIAESLGAIVINRPVDLAGDTSPEWLSWRHAVNWVTENYGCFDGFVSLPATSPLRSQIDVISAIEKRKKVGADICIGITAAGRSPYFNMVKIGNNDLIELINKPNFRINRRQDAPIAFDITTVVYATSADFVLKNDSIFCGTVTSIEVPKERAVDIDDIYDFKFAEVLLSLNNEAR
jgi:CMP-N-acetylneuraminic acid synthetase